MAGILKIKSHDLCYGNSLQEWQTFLQQDQDSGKDNTSVSKNNIQWPIDNEKNSINRQDENLEIWDKKLQQFLTAMIQYTTKSQWH